MPRLFVLVCVALLVPALGEAKTKKFTLRVHAEANSHDGDPFSSEVTSASGRSVVMEKTPVISEQDVASFHPYPANDGTYGALFNLDDHGRLVLETVSAERRGTALYVFVNGRQVAELQVDRRVSDGKLYIPSGLTNADLELMKKTWPAPRPKKN